MLSGSPTRSIDTLMLPTQQSVLVLRQVSFYGVEPTAALRGTGLAPSDLEDDDIWISYRQTIQIIDNAYSLSGRDALGLEVGCSEDISTFGILGYAMLSCDTVYEALLVGQKYQRTAQNMCDVSLEETDDHLGIRAATPFVLSPQQYRFTIEELFSGVLEIIRILTGEHLQPKEIFLAYTEPDYVADYHRVFDCPVVFNSPANVMVLSRKLLGTPVLQANKFNARMSEKLCQQILRKYLGEEGFSTRIRHIILRVPGEFPSEAEVADALAVSGRTLRRQLGEQGITYRKLLDQVRLDLAQQYLRNSGLSIDQIAQLLGYTETTNFRRAFKRWQGVPPREYRLGANGTLNPVPLFASFPEVDQRFKK